MSPSAQNVRRWIDAEIHNSKAMCFDQAMFFRLLNVLRIKTDLLKTSTYCVGDGRDRLRNTFRTINRINRYSRFWIRSPGEWYAVGKSTRAKLFSLIEHLFCNYSVPTFLLNLWLRPEDAFNRSAFNTFLGIASGKSPRACRLQLPVTRSMAGWFLNAPDDLSIWQATRWAQIRAAGGSALLARWFLNSLLGERVVDEEFWQEVIEFFCREEQRREFMFDEDELQELIRFIYEQRFELASQVLGYRVANDRPLQPEFTLRGRSLRWLRRHQTNWPQTVEIPSATSGRTRIRSWQPCGIQGLDVFEGQQRWVIQEILDSEQLTLEGQILQHCVAEYVEECLERTATIWSARIIHEGKSKRKATIEVCPESRRVLQAKGRCNSDPPTQVRRLIQTWCQREQLQWAEKV